MGRKLKDLSQRSEFYIITNGKETESNYFDLIKSKRSIYEVKIIYNNGDPMGLIEIAKLYIKNSNQVWCVFDIDNTYEEKRLIPALIEAKKHNIKIAYSNIAFEVWLITHFKKCKKTLQIKDYEKELNSILKDNGILKKYCKTDKTLLKKYFLPRYKTAIENSKITYQQYFKEFGEQSSEIPPIWKWKSSNTVFKLIDALKLND